jgi:hypothetical protein
LSTEEAFLEWQNAAELYVLKRDKSQATDPQDSNGDLDHAAKCYEHALEYFIVLHTGNNAITAEILNDIAITYHKLTQLKPNDATYQSKYNDAEKKYEIMMQNVKQGIQ